MHMCTQCIYIHLQAHVGTICHPTLIRFLNTCKNIQLVCPSGKMNSYNITNMADWSLVASGNIVLSNLTIKV